MGIVYNLETIRSCKEKLGLLNEDAFTKSQKVSK